MASTELEEASSIELPSTTTTTTAVAGASSVGLASPDSLSRPDSFFSAPTSPLETTENTPTTTISNNSEQESQSKQPEPESESEPVDGPQKLIISDPTSTSKPRTPAPLTTDQQAAYDKVLAAVSAWSEIPATTAKNAPSVPMQEYEYMWLTRECILRYLRATKWNTQNAIKRLQATLSWRREYGADDFTSEYISPENETGKQFLLGFDIEGRPCWYMNPSRQNTKMSDRQIHQVSYMLDRAVDLMPPGQETLALLCSYKNAARGTMPTVSIGKQALNVLQNHNPERLGRCLMQDWPWFMTAFYKLITPFIDPLTKEKIKFDEDLNNFVPPVQLWKDYGGSLDFEYDHELYWPSLKAEAAKRRAAYTERWIAGGKMIGEHEAYLRGGAFKSLRETQAQAADDLATKTTEVKIAP